MMNTCTTGLSNGFYPIIVATKKDKINRSQLLGQLKLIKTTLGVTEGTPVVAFSAETKEGRDDIWDLIETYALEEEEEAFQDAEDEELTTHE